MSNTGPLISSAGYWYDLTEMEIASGFLVATKHQKAHGQNTIRGLTSEFKNLSTPDVIQSDNGSHFSCKYVQDWAKQEGIKWIFHISHCIPTRTYMYTNS